jgi:glycine/serine hydroxymethyltransferase
MKIIDSLIAIATCVAAAGAFAQEATIESSVTPSIASRQSVHEQAAAARAAGTIAYGEAAGHDFAARAASTLTRAQVMAEAREAQRLGLTQAGEVQRVATPAQLDSIRRAGREVAGSAIASRP